MTAGGSAQFATEIRTCAVQLANGDFRGGAPLRTLQERANAAIRLSEDDEARAIAFALFAWIRCYYRNLSGGFPSSVSVPIRQARERLLQDRIAPTLSSLADSMPSTSNTKLALLGRMVSDLYHALEELEALAEGEAA